jgi:hypothetical protein
MSLIDGGVFKCGNHDEEFVTESKEEWDKHLAEHADAGDVKTFGNTNCVVCGKQVVHEDTPVGMNPMHQECKDKLVSGGNVIKE